MKTVTNRPLACNMRAFDASQRREHARIIRRVFRSVKEVRDLPNGLAFRLPTKTEKALETVKFIMLERLCCPFFDFTLKVESSGTTWLHLTGGEGVKEFIRPEFGLGAPKTRDLGRQR